MNEPEAAGAGALAVLTGAVAVGSAACIAAYSAGAEPFGPLNDVGNAATGVLSAALAWRLRSRLPARRGQTAVGAAIAGATISMVGSALVLTHTTGFFLAGLVSTFGFAGIGAWLVVLNRRSRTADWPPRVRTLGAAAGVLMTLGVLAAPAILLRLDDPATAPGWAWLGFTAWLGIYVAYPVWLIRLARHESRESGTVGRRATRKEVPEWTRG